MQNSPSSSKFTINVTLVCLLSAMLVQSAFAASLEWDGIDGDWFLNTNWSTDTVPTAADSARINNGSTVDIDSNGARGRFIVLGETAGESGHVVVDAATDTWTDNTTVFAGFSGTGALDIRNAALVNPGEFYLGYDGTGSGHATVDGAGTTVTNHDGIFQVGRTGSATLTISADAIVSNIGAPLQLAFSASATGILNIGAGGAAGILDAPSVNGGAGAATLNFNHTDSDHYFTDDGTIGGAAVLITGSTVVRQSGTGTTVLTGANTYTGGTSINGGTLLVSADNNLGNATGDLTFDGGALQWGAAFNLAGTRDITLNAGGGIFNATGFTTTVSQGMSGAGALTASGGTLILTGANTYTGGTSINGGTLLVSADNSLGNATGDLTFNGGTLQWGAAFNLAGTRDITLNAGGGTFNATGFTTTVSQGMSGAGALTASGGTLILTGANTYTGGTTVSADNLHIGNGGTTGSITGDVTNNGILLYFNRSDALTFGGVISGTGAIQFGGGGTFTLTGANTYLGPTDIINSTLSVAGAGNLGSGVINLFTSTLEITGATTIANDMALSGVSTVATNGADATLSGILRNFNLTPGGLTKTGANTLTLTGVNTYTEATTITNGTLRVTGSIAGSATTVNAGGTLGGNGTVNGVTVNGGTVAPGTSAGTLNTGTLVLDAASTLDFELDTPGVVGGGVNDLIAVTGNLTLDGTLAITDLGSFGVGDYTLITYTGALTDNGLTLPAPPAGVTYNLTTGGGEVILEVDAVTYNLSYAAGANGSLTGTAAQVVAHGNNGTAVTAVPDVGYHFVQWSDASVANPRTDTGVTADLTVTAQFAINQYTLTYAAGANGSLTGTLLQNVNHGDNGTVVAATADPGYEFTGWSDGSTANPRTDLGVTAAVNVTAQFALLPVTPPPPEPVVIGRAPTADAGGNITRISLDDTLSISLDGSGSHDPEGALQFRWLMGNNVIANGPTLELSLANGSQYQIALLVTDTDGNDAYDLVTVTLKYPDELAYHGVPPDPDLALGLNTIGFYDSSSGLLYTCAAAYDTAGNPLNDRTFNITLAVLEPLAFGNDLELQVLDFARRDIDGVVTEDGEVPDCSGRFFPATLTFEDTLSADGETGFYILELVDLGNLVFRVVSFEVLTAAE